MKHYYIIGVATNPMTSTNPGEMFLKYKPIHVTPVELDSAMKALKLSKDKLFKTPYHDAVTTFGINEKSQVLNMLQLSCQVNDATLHCFVLDEELEDPEEFFDKFVDLANSDNDLKKKLLESKIF